MGYSLVQDYEDLKSQLMNALSSIYTVLYMLKKNPFLNIKTNAQNPIYSFYKCLVTEAEINKYFLNCIVEN